MDTEGVIRKALCETIWDDQSGKPVPCLDIQPQGDCDCRERCDVPGRAAYIAAALERARQEQVAGFKARLKELNVPRILEECEREPYSQPSAPDEDVVEAVTLMLYGSCFEDEMNRSPELADEKARDVLALLRKRGWAPR